MKTIFLNIIMCVLIFKTHAQIALPETFDITYNKTTSVIFPFGIKSVDRGSKDILVQKAKGVDNVLHVKAAHRGFAESNLTIITDDGLIHEFTVNYSDSPSQRTYFIHPDYDNHESVRLSSGTNSRRLANACMNILKWKSTNEKIHKKKYKLKLSLDGIYIQDNTLFYRLNISNRSNLNYNIQSLRFFIKDKRQIKRSASQEIEVEPIFIQGQTDKVTGKSSINLVYAFPLFTIPEAKKLTIELFENNGGRNLSIEVNNRSIVKATPLRTGK